MTSKTSGPWLASRREFLSALPMAGVSIATGLGMSLPTGVFGAAAGDFTWNIGSPVVQDHWMLHSDNVLGYVKQGKELSVIYGRGGNPKVTPWVRYSGTGMDDLTKQPDAVLDASFDRPYKDDLYWPGQIWVDPDTGVWHTTVHIEFNYWGDQTLNPWPQRRIGLATSRDRGASWYYKGDIITKERGLPLTEKEYRGQWVDCGLGDHRLYVDSKHGFFYIQATHYWILKRTPETSHLPAVRDADIMTARAPISGKMAPGTWKKWYNGVWKEPGIGGRHHPLFEKESAGCFFYSRYLDCYLSFRNGQVRSCRNLAKNEWSPPRPFPASLLWYQTAVDLGTYDPYNMGRTCRFYCSDFAHSHYLSVAFKRGR